MTTPDNEQLAIDFIGGSARHRRQFGGGRNQPLARAIGIVGEAPTVIDATAGTGSDGWVLASLGCQMTWVERNAIVHQHLAEALQRASVHPETSAIAQRIHLVHTDAADYILQLEDADRPEVIYLDPMYPHKTKSAASRGAMQVLQKMLGPDTDSARLLAAALSKARKRVAVKRPLKAPMVEGPTPSGSIRSPNTRYDIYGGAALAAITE